ncbi:9788_t:CDS:2, partial [Funneliformis geosporum]
MGLSIMSDKLPTNVKDWTSAHIKKHLKRHMNNSSYNEDNIEKIEKQNTDEHSTFVEVVTVSEFNKLRDNYQKILKENYKIINNMLSKIKILHGK